MHIVDFHTHAFPDAVAERAIPMLETGGARAVLDGKISSLLKSMDANGIEKSVVCSIATKPEHFLPILEWSKQIASDRIIPFPSIHPDDPKAVEKVRMVKGEGFLGIKIHPYYQEFDVDEDRMLPIYEALQETGLIVLCHCGFDMSFAYDRKGDPEKILRVTQAFPELKFVAAHLGAWDDWEEVKRHLLGKPIYMDISYSIDVLSRPESMSMLSHQEAETFLRAHPKEYILFGTDSPWADHHEVLQSLLSLNLDKETQECILSRNANRLLASVG